MKLATTILVAAMSASSLIHAAPVPGGSSREQWTSEHQKSLESLTRMAENLHQYLTKPSNPDQMHAPSTSEPAKETIELHAAPAAAPATKPLEGWPRHLANAALGFDTKKLGEVEHLQGSTQEITDLGKKLDKVEHVQGSMEQITDIGKAFHQGLHL